MTSIGVASTSISGSTATDGATGEGLGTRVHRVMRDIPDFPSAGIVFKDITPLLQDPVLFADVLAAMAQPFAGAGITHVAAIESRGFLFGPTIAMALGARLVPVRKPNKLPWHTVRVEYTLEYGTDALEVHRDAFPEGARVLIVDDVLATGGTATAAGQLVTALAGAVCGATFLGELPALRGREHLRNQFADIAVAAVLQF